MEPRIRQFCLLEWNPVNYTNNYPPRRWGIYLSCVELHNPSFFADRKQGSLACESRWFTSSTQKRVCMSAFGIKIRSLLRTLNSDLFARWIARGQIICSSVFTSGYAIILEN
ncbi:hypothetical protein N7454_009690 [Penicillium verhagenii]|nr:hypothetical protein N7454_009690 [Penicillium verhagenii]